MVGAELLVDPVETGHARDVGVGVGSTRADLPVLHVVEVRGVFAHSRGGGHAVPRDEGHVSLGKPPLVCQLLRGADT